MTKFNVNNSGNLEITLTDEGRELLSVLGEQYNDETAFIDLIETQLCNGYCLVKPEDVGAITSSLLITDGFYDDNGDFPKQDCNIWYYNYYAVRSYLADLKEYGTVIWNKA
jgi:hypothetical protein